MLAPIINGIFIIFILILLYGAALIVIDKERAYTERQKLKTQADEQRLSQTKDKHVR